MRTLFGAWLILVLLLPSARGERPTAANRGERVKAAAPVLQGMKGLLKSPDGREVGRIMKENHIAVLRLTNLRGDHLLAVKRGAFSGKLRLKLARDARTLYRNRPDVVLYALGKEDVADHGLSVRMLEQSLATIVTEARTSGAQAFSKQRKLSEYVSDID